MRRNLCKSASASLHWSCYAGTTYYAFGLAKPHRGKTALQVDNRDDGVLGISVAASRSEKELVLTCVNPRHDIGLKVEIELSSGKTGDVGARMIQHNDYNACNTFDAPDRIKILKHEVAGAGSKIGLDLPPMSVVTVTSGLS